MKKKITVLFVDDEKKKKDGLRRKLRKKRKVWIMLFAVGGYEAKRCLLKNDVDIIITDMKMPGTSGQELLKYVRNKYPETIRLVLSGYSDKEVLLQSTKLAHQYLSKPIDTKKIENAISRSIKLKKVLKAPQLIKLGSQLKTIPSIPDIYDKIMKEMQKPESSLQKVGKIIETDIGMSAKILQLVNSSFFGSAKHIESPAQAAVMLGLNVLKSLVLSIHLFEQFKQSNISPQLLNKTWNHGMAVGKLAKNIAVYLKLDKKNIDYSFMAGILHDVGKIIMMSEFPETYNDIIKETKSEHKAITSLENKYFKATHAELGAYVLGIWGLQQPIIEAIIFHHQPNLVENDNLLPLTAVHIANVINYENHPNYIIGKSPDFDMEYLENLGIHKKIKKFRKIASK